MRSIVRCFSSGQGVFQVFRRFRSRDTTVKEILQKTDRLHHADHHTDVEKMYKTVMRKVPQPVIIVTTGIYTRSGWNKRGMTCTSFTSVSFCPPIISVCIQNPSRMHDMMLKSKHFALHVLAKHQVSYGMTFAQYPKNGCQFDQVPHYEGENNVPIILGSCAVMECKAHSVHTVGDHHVWYGEVHDAHVDDKISHPMLYHFRSFRSVGDEIFIQSFEEATLPFEDWTHEAHLRMAWTYIKERGREGAEPLIKSGIKKYNEKNLDKIKTGYSETITMFYIFAVSDAIKQTPNVSEMTFEEFLKQNGHLLDRSLMYEYYDRDIIGDPVSKTEFILPNKKRLPGVI